MRRTTDVIPGQLRERNQKRTGMAWKNLIVWITYWLKNSKNKERRHGFLCISRPILGLRSMVTVGEGTEDAPTLSAEGGTENVAWSDRVTNTEIWKRKNTKNMVAVADSLKWNWKGHVAEGHKLCQCGTSE